MTGKNKQSGLRVLHTVHAFPPESCGGTETYVLELTRAQLRIGDIPAIFCGSEGGDPDPAVKEEDRGGVPLFRLRPRPAHAYSLDTRDPDGRAHFLATLANFKPDLVHVHHWHNLSTDLIAAAAEQGIPAVASLHDYFSTCPFFFRLPDLDRPCGPQVGGDQCLPCLERALADDPELLRQAIHAREGVFRREMDRAAAVIFVSPATLAFQGQNPLFAGANTTMLPLPKPSHATAPAVSGDRPAGVDLRLVTWGGVVPGKGMQTLVAACEKLTAPERVSLDHYGKVLDEPFADSLRAQAKRMQLRFNGPFSWGASQGIFDNYDMAIFPSFFMETHGFVLDEALGLGLPVIVSDRGAPPERVGDRGLVFPAGDVSALHRLLQEVIADPAILTRLRQGTPTLQISMADHYQQLDQIYRSALTHFFCK